MDDIFAKAQLTLETTIGKVLLIMYQSELLSKIVQQIYSIDYKV